MIQAVGLYKTYQSGARPLPVLGLLGAFDSEIFLNVANAASEVNSLGC